MNNGEFQAHTERIDQLVQRATALKDEEGRNTALDLLQSTMDLHGMVMARIVEILASSGDAGRGLLDKLGGDPLVCGLLVLYGIHPVDVQTRVTRALEKIRPRLRKQSGAVELISVNEGVVRVRIENTGHGCGSSKDAIRLTVEQAILEVAPEVGKIIAEGGASPAADGFIPLSTIQGLRKEDKHYEEPAG